jgi:hypothetical protein
LPTPHPLPDLPGVYYAKIDGAAEGLPSNNIFTFAAVPAPLPGAPDLAFATALSVAISTHWPTFATGVMSQAYTANEVQVYALHSPVSPAVTDGITATGGTIGAISGLMVAKMVRHQVHRRGRGSQSRSSFSPVPASEITADGKSITGATAATLTTDFLAFITAVLTDVNTATGATWRYVQLSFRSATLPAATYDITSSNAEALLTTQRRRVRRNG